MQIEEQIEELKILSNEELRKKFETSRNDTYILKSALRRYDTISNNSLTRKKMAEMENQSKSYISQQRCILIKYGLIEPEFKCAKTGNIKKLITQRHKGKIDYRYFVLNMAELKAANLELKKDYFVIVEPADRAFTVKVFDTPEEAKKYKVSSKKSQT